MLFCNCNWSSVKRGYIHSLPFADKIEDAEKLCKFFVITQCSKKQVIEHMFAKPLLGEDIFVIHSVFRFSIS